MRLSKSEGGRVGRFPQLHKLRLHARVLDVHGFQHRRTVPKEVDE